MKQTMTMTNLPVGTPVQVSGVTDMSYLIQPHRNKVVFLTDANGGGSRNSLRCGPGRRIKNNGARGPWARWKMSGDSEHGFTLQNVGHRNKGKEVFLAVHNGAFAAVDYPETLKIEPSYGIESNEQQLQDWENIPQVDGIPMQISYELSDESRKSFMDTGLLHLPGLVDQELVDNALRSINERLGAAWNTNKPREADYLEGKKELAIRDLLFKSALFSAVEELLGKGKAERPNGGQLALRFPNNKRRDPDEEQWHIDGMRKPHMNPFQLLVGVALSSQPTEDCGNLAVFPGFHGVVHEAVSRVRESRELTANVMKDKDDDSTDFWDGQRPILGPHAAIQLKLEPGDAVIVHQKLPHRISRNKSPHVRYMVYFRISHVNHKKNGPLGGLWAHFDGLQDLVSE